MCDPGPRFVEHKVDRFELGMTRMDFRFIHLLQERLLVVITMQIAGRYPAWVEARTNIEERKRVLEKGGNHCGIMGIIGLRR